MFQWCRKQIHFNSHSHQTCPQVHHYCYAVCLPCSETADHLQVVYSKSLTVQIVNTEQNKKDSNMNPNVQHTQK